ncbi:winged helix-turn-helix domain-containing protein [Photobacterium lipolyticum]|uniref:OmpR/PhoB-type domain-containing protein n=1 Tax=Photobacterium lipolyticum TaxID=266810 RepID=A0A2T3MZI5_9GAMM|nr:winged helix-turn-helix domain-containing protein [Photobacterium lipolyticum]PSW05384.1 hypothetical protein C9I89_08985 [Photobacterium lipolyticum]
MTSTEQIKFRTDVCYIPSLCILKSSESTQKLNQSEQYILTYLLDKHHRPVTKDELLTAGWPGRNVTEASLFQVLRALRVKLQEEEKGDVIETVPRIGYRIHDFVREKISLQEDAAPVLISHYNVSKQTILLTVIGLTLAAGLAAWFSLKNNAEPKIYIVKNKIVEANSLTLIGHTHEAIEDLNTKIINLYQGHKEQLKQASLIKRKIVAYKGHSFYSVAWCQTDEKQQCIANTDFSYNIQFSDWSEFTNIAAQSINTYRENPIIQTELVRKPTAQVYKNYLDDSGIESKIVHYYISRDDNDNLSYSLMSFIKEKNDDYHHALSVRVATLSQYNEPTSFLASAVIEPKMFNWAYQPNKEIVADKSMALINEQQMEDDFINNRTLFSHLVYHQDYLDLILHENRGLYWLHYTQTSTDLFKPAISQKDTRNN